MNRGSIGTRHLAVAAVAVILPLSAPPAASAIAPPPVDATLLPQPGPPAPAQPTERHEHCYTAGPGDAAEKSQTQLDSLALPTVWRLTRGAGQTVAVIDTGVARHRLLPRLVPGGDYVSRGDGTEDCDGHGTIVAGIIGAAPDSDEPKSFRGIASEADVIGIRQSSSKFRPTGRSTGSGIGDVETLAMAVRTAADMGATVINVSSVACLAATDDLDDRSLGAALAYAVDVKNVVVVAAAGNVGGPGQCPEQNPASGAGPPNQPDWENLRSVVSPPWYDDLVLTVGSVGADGAPSRFSMAGPWVDVAAPGEGVVSLDPDGDGLIDTLPGPGGPKPIAGTSYAAPVVSAVAALVRSRWPRLTARQVMRRIEDTAHRPSAGWDPFVGNGVVDALAAVSGSVSNAQSLGNTAGRVAPTPPAAPSNTRPARVAFWGTAICIVVSVAAVLSRGQLRSSD